MPGDKTNNKKLVFILNLNSFVKSFTASEMGCKIPTKKVLFGPFRFCENLINLRSIKVKNATLNRILTIDKMKLINDIKIIK